VPGSGFKGDKHNTLERSPGMSCTALEDSADDNLTDTEAS